MNADMDPIDDEGLSLYLVLHHPGDPHPNWTDNKWQDDDRVERITTDPATAEECRRAEIVYIHRCCWKPEGRKRVGPLTSCSVRVERIGGSPDRPTVFFREATVIGRPVPKRLYGFEKPHYYAHPPV